MGAITAPEHDPAALVAVLERYRDDPALRERHGARAPERALATYDADVVARHVEGLLTR